MDCVVNPPVAGEPSYELYITEKRAILDSLANRASSIAKAVNSIPGIKCNTVQGAMYAFPQVNAATESFSSAAFYISWISEKLNVSLN